MTCFFDPSHAPGSVSVLWSPQWGVARPVQACGSCAQRAQTTAPPYYMPQGAPQPGYPAQPPASGYPQQGYPRSGGYAAPQPGYPQQGYPAQPQRQGHSTGAVVGAGVAGLIGGALIGEMMADSERPREEIIENNEIVENNYDDYYEDNRGDFDGDFDGGYDQDGGFF